MIVTKKALPRRTVLRVSVRRSHCPSWMRWSRRYRRQHRPLRAVPRLGFIYAPNGMYLPNFHPAGQGGKAFALTPILKPLEPFRDQLVVVSGLSNYGVVSPNEGGGVHTGAHGGWLNGVLAETNRWRGPPCRQDGRPVCGRLLGAGTSLRSLELTTETNYQVGNCENGYSCAYLNSHRGGPM